MRLGTVIHADRKIVVAATDSGLVDLTAACGFADMLTLIANGALGLETARAALDTAPRIKETEVTFLAPLPRPEQLRDCLVFEEHLINAFAKAREMTGRDFAIPSVWYDQPIYYKSNRFSVTGGNLPPV